jgi:hypothetical protein
MCNILFIVGFKTIPKKEYSPNAGTSMRISLYLEYHFKVKIFFMDVVCLLSPVHLLYNHPLYWYNSNAGRVFKKYLLQMSGY